jgi:hypothetical protein
MEQLKDGGNDLSWYLAVWKGCGKNIETLLRFFWKPGKSKVGKIRRNMQFG